MALKSLPEALRLLHIRSEKATARVAWNSRARLIPGRTMRRLIDGIFACRERGRNRLLFTALNKRMLRDIGIDCSPTDSNGMAWFWRLH